MKRLTSLLLFFCAGITFGQEQTTAALQTPESKGLHKIKLSHKIRSFANKDLRDLRVLDTENNQVPYFIEKAKTEIQASNFSTFKIIEKTKNTDTSSTYIFINPNDKINQVVLKIANYKGFKYYDILGSDNQKQWFGIVNNQHLSNITSYKNTNIHKVIHFPLCSYKYLKLIFNDRNSLPINLLEIGKSNLKISTSTTEEIPFKNLSISSLKEQKKTKIEISFNFPEIINTVKFNINAPDFYKRNAILYSLNKTEIKRKETLQKHIIKRLVLKSGTPNEFNIPSFFGNKLYLEIENQDNPALEVGKITFLQNSLYAIADLKKDNDYTLSVGDKTLFKPNYDIGYFKSIATEELPIIDIITINYPKEKEEVINKVSFWQQPWFMWGAIGLATLLIIFVVSGLVKDMKQSQT